MRGRSLALALLLLLALAGGALASSFVWRVGTSEADATTRLRTLVDREHTRVCGRHLDWDSRLAAAARFKATDMGYHDRLSHTNAAGEHVWDSYKRAGIRWSLAAEDIGWNNAPDAGAADFVFKQFMDSSSHRAAIRFCGYRSFGVGSFQTVPDKKWFAVEFIVP